MTKTLFAGTACIEITPQALDGLNPFGPDFTDVHDPLFVKALALRSGEEVALLITADLVEVGITDEIRARLSRLGVDAGSILIAPSHSHNAPRIGLVPKGGKARIPSAQSLVYTQSVYAAMEEAARAALAALQPVRIGISSESVDVNVCREEYQDGAWILGRRPEGLSDKTLTVVAIENLAGAPLATVMNYAVHPTVMLGLREVSADLAGVAVAQVEWMRGGMAFWTSGALGDQAPKISLGEPSGDVDRDRAFAQEAVHAQGFLLGQAATRIARADHDHLPIAARTEVIPCPVRKLEVPPGMEQADVPFVDLTLTCLRIGPLALAGVSGEVTVPVAQALAARAALRVAVVSNANARIGYLPTDESYDRDTHAARGCPIVKGHAEGAILRGMSALIDRLAFGEPR
jgi:neutral ceramidase